MRPFIVCAAYLLLFLLPEKTHGQDPFSGVSHPGGSFIVLSMNETISILDSTGDERFSMNLRTPGFETNAIQKTPVQHLFRIKKEDRCGLFDARKGDFVFLPEYDLTPSIDRMDQYQAFGKDDFDYRFGYFVARQRGRYLVYHEASEQILDQLLDINILSHGELCYRNAEGKSLYSGGIGQEVIPLNYVGVWDDCIMVEENGKYGLLNPARGELIPLQYDNIYAAGGDYFWCAKGNRWALVRKNNDVITPFEFLAIDQLNRVNFNNLLYVTQISKEEYLDLVWHNDRNHSADTEELRSWLRLLGKTRDSHILFSAVYVGTGAPTSFALKTDGYHLIQYLPQPRVDNEAWDDIYLIPDPFNKQRVVGVRLGAMYGFIDEVPLFAEGLVFNHRYDHLFCLQWLAIEKGQLKEHCNTNDRWTLTELMPDYKVKYKPDFGW